MSHKQLNDAGHIQPVVDQVFSFDQAHKALTYLELGWAKGKVVVQLIKQDFINFFIDRGE